MTLSKSDVINKVPCPICYAEIGQSCSTATWDFPDRSHWMRISNTEKIHATEQKRLAKTGPPS